MSRSKFLNVCLILVVSVIGVRLFYIQIIQHSEWTAKAEARHTLENTIVAERGDIYMMDESHPIAVVLNETVYSVIVDPMLTDEEKAKETVEKYAKDNIVAKWDDVFKDKTMRYYVVAKNVSRKNAEAIMKEEVHGIWFQENNKRVYPEGEMASELLGFVNADGEGQYGTEGAFNKELSGKNGLLKTVTDVNQVALSIGNDNIRMPAVDGDNIVLTIDRNIQRKIEKILADKVNNSVATHASAIVMNPNNGKVLAMANVPNYNPADYGNVKDASAYQNNVLEGAYEPASVCKTFTFAAAIDLGVMSPETTYYNAGKMTVDGLTFVNAYRGKLGEINMQTALNYSLNTGSATALKLISGGNFTQDGRQKLYDYYYNRFGLGEYTGVELYEVPGHVPAPDEYDYTMDYTYANLTFGQGLNVTMAQVAAAVSSIVNGGFYYEPTVLAGKMVNGEFVPAESKNYVRKTVSETTSNTMRAMLYGTRNSRRLYGIDKAGYYVGGKTGTAQVIQKDGKYSDAMGETIASYVGFGGTEGELPEYLIMVKIWGEGKHLEGERDAMPLFDSISNYLQTYLKIKPKGQ